MSKPRVLVLDLETSPNLADVWGLWQQNVALSQLREVTNVICWAAKWHGEKRCEFRSDFHDGHAPMIERAHQLLDEADAVVGHNITTFDIPHLKREFLLAGLNPPSPFVLVDTLRIVKSQFRFSSNKLQHISTQLGQAGKVQHGGHSLWVRCMAGDAKAWAEMRKYNIGDVTETEDVYNRLRPWAPQSMTPHHGLYSGDDCCGRCGGTDLQRRGTAKTTIAEYQRFQCNTCGSWSRGKKALESVDARGI